MRAQFVFQEIWIGLRRNLTMTIALIVTVAIGMALFGTGLLIKSQVDNSKGYWYDKIEVSVYLCNTSSTNPGCAKTPATQAQKDAIKSTLEGMKGQVQWVRYESQQEAYERFKVRFASTPGFVQAARPQDLPDSFRVKLKNPSEYKTVAAAVQGGPGVDQVFNEQETLKKFFTVLTGLQVAALVIAGIQVVAAILLIANTMRLSAFNRRRETGIMRLVGASNLYIQMPFVLEGVIAGFIGGLFASVLLIFAKMFLIDRLQGNLQFASQVGAGSLIYAIVMSIVFGVLLCAVSSFLTLRRYLRV